MYQTGALSKKGQALLQSAQVLPSRAIPRISSASSMVDLMSGLALSETPDQMNLWVRPDGTIVYSSQALYSRIGGDRDSLIHTSIWDSFPELTQEDWPHWLTVIENEQHLALVASVNFPTQKPQQAEVRCRYLSAGKEALVLVTVNLRGDHIDPTSGRYYVEKTDKFRARDLSVLQKKEKAEQAARLIKENFAYLHTQEQLSTSVGKVARVGGWKITANSELMSASRSFTDILRLGSGAPVTIETFLGCFRPQDREQLRASIDNCVLRGERWSLETQLPQPHSRVWLRVSGAGEPTADGRFDVAGSVQDISEARKIRASLAKNNEFMALTLNSIGDGVITTDASGNVSWMNPTAEKMAGWMFSEAYGRPIETIFHLVNEASGASVENPVRACLSEGKVVGLCNDTQLLSRAGDYFGISDSTAPLRNERGELMGAVVVFHDVTEQRKLSAEMDYRAKHDGLTGLVNRSEFEHQLGSMLKALQEDQTSSATLFIDLDKFKLVNDSCGHAAGDECLIQITNIFKRSIRATDTLARLGGDEFAIILDQCELSQAREIAESLCVNMENYRYIHEGERFRVGASVGLVSIDSGWRRVKDIIQAADTACYMAKEKGGNRVHTWLPCDVDIVDRNSKTQWANRIEKALDDNQFSLYVQGITPLASEGDLWSGEVLLRMKTDDGELVCPNTFFPAAERFHLAAHIDRWVLTRVVEVLRSTPHKSRINRLSVNLSGQSIGDKAFLNAALNLLKEAGTEVSQRLCLEITESVAIKNIAEVSRFIADAHEIGVVIALDDFGSGATFFSYLTSLKADVLKVDGKFIRHLMEPVDQIAVRCFVDVAQTLNMKTVAEYVDCEETLERVRALNIDYAQGNLIHVPESLSNVLNRI